MTDLPGDTPPEATALEVPAGSEFDQSREDTATSLPRLQDTQTPEVVPQVTAPVPDDLSSLEGIDISPSGVPQAGAAQGGLSAPEAPETSAGIAVESEDPVLPNPQATAPEAPSGEEELSISTEPAQPVMPETEEESAAFPEPEPEAGAETEATAPQAGAGDAQDALPETKGADPQEVQPDAAGTDTAAAEQEPQAEMQPGAEPEPDGQGAEAPADNADTAGPTDSSEGASTIGNLAQGVTTNRLPTAVDPAPEPAEAAATPEAAAEPEAPAEDTRPPIERFAAEFDNPDGKPLMAIILIDDGSSPIGPEALADFPYPLSFAVDASLPDAADTAAKYRAAGFEVLAMANLPENAAATDAEVAMETYLAAVPEAVAVFEGTGTGLQASREASAQLAPILRDSGHGLVMFANGLNTAQKLIAREGVPAATVFRDFDANGQNASAVRRFLDQAAFRAGQEEGGVIMVGRLRPDTISALLLWGLQDRAASVALAPVSAILTAR